MTKGKDKYLFKAAEARGKAEQASSAELAAEWLQISGAWMELVGRRQATRAEQKFDDRAHSEGTGQDISSRSQ